MKRVALVLVLLIATVSTRAAIITFNEGTTATFLDLTLDYSDGFGEYSASGNRVWRLNNPGPTSTSNGGWSVNFGVGTAHGALGASTIFSELAFLNFSWLCDLTFSGTSGLEDPKLSFFNGWKGLQGANWEWETPNFEYVDGDTMRVRFTWDVAEAVPDAGMTAALLLVPLAVLGWAARHRRG